MCRKFRLRLFKGFQALGLEHQLGGQLTDVLGVDGGKRHESNRASEHRHDTAACCRQTSHSASEHTFLHCCVGCGFSRLRYHASGRGEDCIRGDRRCGGAPKSCRQRSPGSGVGRLCSGVRCGRGGVGCGGCSVRHQRSSVCAHVGRCFHRRLAEQVQVAHEVQNLQGSVCLAQLQHLVNHRAEVRRQAVQSLGQGGYCGRVRGLLEELRDGVLQTGHRTREGVVLTFKVAQTLGEPRKEQLGRHSARADHLHEFFVGHAQPFSRDAQCVWHGIPELLVEFFKGHHPLGRHLTHGL